MASSGTKLRQKSEYTHRHNAKIGRHGWLRLTPAYSLKIVEELLESSDVSLRILDPFCGTATTALSSIYHGHQAVTTDINPFLIWLGQAKTATYSEAEIDRTSEISVVALRAIRDKAVFPAAVPPIHKIERWWAPEALEFLSSLKSALYGLTHQDSAERNLLMVAFCRTLISLSNASFNHQSMSFKNEKQMVLANAVDMPGIYEMDVNFVVNGAADNPEGAARVLLADSRDLPRDLDKSIDIVITSPPYVNRMSYIRELRPYMYWLDWLTNGREAGELDWKAIGGTWGIATSRLSDWRRETGHFDSKGLEDVLFKVAHADNKNGVLLAQYITKYFDDMWAHFQSLTKTLKPSAEVHYIVGNSTFYGVLLSAESFFQEMLSSLGFRNVQCLPIRKRNSKKELIEFDVSASWPG